MVKHVFFHFNTMAHHIALALHMIMNMINYGALLRLMLMEITLKTNGETVTATVKQVKQVWFTTVFPHTISAETILFWIWKSKSHST